MLMHQTDMTHIPEFLPPLRGPDRVPGSWFKPDLALVIVTIKEVSQKMKDEILTLSLPSSLR